MVNFYRFYRSLTDGMLEPEVYHMNPAKSDTALFRKITGLLPKSISWYGAYLFKVRLAALCFVAISITRDNHWAGESWKMENLG